MSRSAWKISADCGLLCLITSLV